jgi:hypothetical protein
MLKRQFPEWLRMVCCDTPGLDCRACDTAPKCAYARLFVPVLTDEVMGINFIDDAAMPFTIKPGVPEGAGISFDVVLAGEAMVHLPAVVETFRQMGTSGYGRERVMFRITSVTALDAGMTPRSEGVQAENMKKITGLPPLQLAALTGEVSVATMKSATLNFVTPPMLTQGRDGFRPPFDILIRRLRDRVRVVGLLHCGGEPDMNLKGLAVKSDDVRISGFGPKETQTKVTYSGIMRDFFPLLRLGQYLHVGSFCAFGQGRYEIEKD